MADFVNNEHKIIEWKLFNSKDDPTRFYAIQNNKILIGRDGIYFEQMSMNIVDIFGIYIDHTNSKEYKVCINGYGLGMYIECSDSEAATILQKHMNIAYKTCLKICTHK